MQPDGANKGHVVDLRHGRSTQKVWQMIWIYNDYHGVHVISTGLVVFPSLSPGEAEIERLRHEAGLLHKK